MPVTTPALIDAMRRISELLRTGAYRAAHDELEPIVAANPWFVEALRLLVGAKQALADPAAAETLLRRALALDPHWMPTRTTLGERLLGNGRGSEAEPLLQRAAAGPPPYPRAALLLARYYNDTGRTGEALAAAAPLCLSGKADAELAAQHIAALAALGRQEEAVAAYRRIMSAAPDNLAAAHALAIALNTAGQPAEAAQVAQRTLARGHQSAALHNTYARSLIAQGTLDRAEEALRACLAPAAARAQAPPMVLIRAGLAALEFDPATAVGLAERALRLLPDNAPARNLLAAAQLGVGDAGTALTHCERLLADAPDDQYL